MSLPALRRYLIDPDGTGAPCVAATWFDLDAVNEPEVMDQIEELAIGESMTLGQCDPIVRLPDAPVAFAIITRPGARRPRIWAVRPDGASPTGLDIDHNAPEDVRSQVHAATSLDELRALPFVIG